MPRVFQRSTDNVLRWWRALTLLLTLTTRPPSSFAFATFRNPRQSAFQRLVAPAKQRYNQAPTLNQRHHGGLVRSLSLDDVIEMDVVKYRLNDDDDTIRLAAMQGNGLLAPLSVWSVEPMFGNSLECVVDEDDYFALQHVNLQLHARISIDALTYGSRQVGGGKGPGNPHGEESELLYYIDANELHDVTLLVKPELEITW